MGNFIDVRHVRQPQANRLHWTEEEYAILREMYPTADSVAILEMLPDRTWRGIVKVASKLKITRGPKNTVPSDSERVKGWSFWSEDEDTILREMYARADAGAILEMLPDRTWTGVKRHANELGLLRERGGKAKDERLPASIRNAGIRKQGNWSEEENTILREMYPGAKATEILELLPNRNWKSVISHAFELGITRKREKMITSLSYINPEDRKYEEENGLIPSVKNDDWSKRLAIHEERG